MTLTTEEELIEYINESIKTASLHNVLETLERDGKIYSPVKYKASDDGFYLDVYIKPVKIAEYITLNIVFSEGNF